MSYKTFKNIGKNEEDEDDEEKQIISRDEIDNLYGKLNFLEDKVVTLEHQAHQINLMEEILKQHTKKINLMEENIGNRLINYVYSLKNAYWRYPYRGVFIGAVASGITLLFFI